MSETTREINKITGMIIGISVRLILYALILLLMYEGATKGYAFGYEVFHSTPAAAAPGVNRGITVRNDSVSGTAKQLKAAGLITNEYVFMIQSKFYDYKIFPGDYTFNTSMTSKEMLQLLNEDPKDKEEAAEDDSK